MELPCPTAVSDRSIPLFEKEGPGEICQIILQKIPLIPPFCKGGCNSARADPIQNDAFWTRVPVPPYFAFSSSSKVLSKNCSDANLLFIDRRITNLGEYRFESLRAKGRAAAEKDFYETDNYPATAWHLSCRQMRP